MSKNTIIMFSEDLDKAMASMIIVNGAAAMGNDVTVFFTFWGLNLLRKRRKVKIKKSFMDKMFGMMMPRGASKTKLSKMNMGGIGTLMMKGTMKKKKVQTLQELMNDARDMGAKFIACKMSMDIMGIQKEELLDGIEYAGVATYLGEADEGTINLFI